MLIGTWQQIASEAVIKDVTTTSTEHILQPHRQSMKCAQDILILTYAEHASTTSLIDKTQKYDC